MCIGLNGLMYEISERFARKLNQIMQKEANIVIFDSRWFEFLHKAKYKMPYERIFDEMKNN